MTQYTYFGQSLIALDRALKQQHEGGGVGQRKGEAAAEDVTSDEGEGTPRAQPRHADHVSVPRRDAETHGRARNRTSAAPGAPAAHAAPGQKGLTPPRRSDGR